VVEIEQAIVHLKRAVEIDPDFALAHAGLADAYNILGDQHAILPHEAAASARAAIERAREIDPDLGEAYTSLGFVRMFYDWDWVGAQRAFERGLELNPGYPTGHQWYSEFLSATGDSDRAIAEAASATELDPFSTIIATTLGDAYFFARRYEESLAALRRALELDPSFISAMSDIGRTLSQLGRHEEAIAAFEHTLAQQGGDRLVSGGLGYALAIGGRRDEARQILERLIADSSKRQVSAHAIAAIHLGLGQHEDALDWLERAYREHDRALAWIRVHPRLDPVRGHPRFEEIVRRVMGQ
jgi:tetratricopeptide (TPR) repeat protein